MVKFSGIEGFGSNKTELTFATDRPLPTSLFEIALYWFFPSTNSFRNEISRRSAAACLPPSSRLNHCSRKPPTNVNHYPPPIEPPTNYDDVHKAEVYPQTRDLRMITAYSYFTCLPRKIFKDLISCRAERRKEDNSAGRKRRTSSSPRFSAAFLCWPVNARLIKARAGVISRR